MDQTDIDKLLSSRSLGFGQVLPTYLMESSSYLFKLISNCTRWPLYSDVLSSIKLQFLAQLFTVWGV